MKRINIRPQIQFRAIAVIGALMLSACMSKSPLNGSKPVSADKAIVAPLGAVNLRLGQVLITGIVSRISSGELVIDNLTFRTDSLTDLPAGLLPGMLARVVAINLPDNTRYAIEVAPVEGYEGNIAASKPTNNNSSSSSNSSSNSGEFEFSGIVEKINGSDWMISSYAVQLDPMALSGPKITVGSTVHVDGFLVNGTLVVKEIKVDVNHEHETESGSLSTHKLDPTPEAEDTPPVATPGVESDYPTPSRTEVGDQETPTLTSTQTSGSDSENPGNNPGSSENGGSSNDDSSNNHNRNRSGDDGGGKHNGDGRSGGSHGGN